MAVAALRVTDDRLPVLSYTVRRAVGIGRAECLLLRNMFDTKRDREYNNNVPMIILSRYFWVFWSRLPLEKSSR